MGESKAEQLVGLAEAVAIVAIFPSFMLVVWAISTTDRGEYREAAGAAAVTACREAS